VTDETRGQASGLPARGYSWPAFERGNSAAVKHGAYAVVQLAPRAAEFAEDVRARMPLYSPADEGAVQHYAMLRARLERASQALEAADEASAGDPQSSYLEGSSERIDRLARLRDDARRWHRLVLAYERELGLTPLARSRLGLNIAAAGRAALDEYLESRYSEGGTDDA
jgi:hypothetical protein